MSNPFPSIFLPSLSLTVEEERSFGNAGVNALYVYIKHVPHENITTFKDFSPVLFVSYLQIPRNAGLSIESLPIDERVETQITMDVKGK